jgi:hypothetical protein
MRRRARTIGLPATVSCLTCVACLTSVHRAQSVGSAVHLPAGLTYVTSSTENSPRTVWAASLAGTESERLGPGEGPLVSPDGLFVAAALSGVTTGGRGPALVVYSATGGLTHRYLDLASESAQPLAWSRDSRYLAVSTQPTVTIGGPEKPSALAILDVKERVMRVIVHGEIKGASFAPDLSDRLVFARAGSPAPEAATNLYSVGPTGTGLRRLTSDGRSLNPVCGSSSVVAYDRERVRWLADPVLQIRLRSHSGRTRVLAGIGEHQPGSGLVPLGFSADGSRLLAGTQHGSEAWVVRVDSRIAHRLTDRGHPVAGRGMSADGSKVLVEEGSRQMLHSFLEGRPARQRLSTIPFSGGAATVLVTRASQASWNG